MSAWLSVVVPTAGTRHDSLIRTLESIRKQRDGDQVEIVVAADTYAVSDRGGLDVSSQAVETYRGRWLEVDAGLHMVGQPQRTAGAKAARGEWVAFSQDDNVLAEDALKAIHAGVMSQIEPRPLFFRARMHWGEIVWHEPKLRLANIDADCLVFPRAIAHEVVWGLRYEGDYDAAEDAYKRCDGNVDWREDVIAIARPEREHWWWMR